MAIGRREFVTHGAAAAAGAGLGVGGAAYQSQPAVKSSGPECPVDGRRFLEVVFYGLVMFLEDTAEVVCLNANAKCSEAKELDIHHPWLRVPQRIKAPAANDVSTSYGTLINVSGASLSFPSITSSSSLQIVGEGEATWPWQSIAWLPDLRAVETTADVVDELPTGAGGVVLTYLKLTTGTIEAMEPQSPLATVLSWEFASKRRAVTDRFMWRVPIVEGPGNYFPIDVTAFGQTSRRVEVKVPESQLRIELRNMPHWRDPGYAHTVLAHAEAYFNILKNCSTLGTKDTKLPKCPEMKSDHWGIDLASVFPTSYQQDGSTNDSHAMASGSAPRWIRTGGSDPICVAMRLSKKSVAP